MATSPSKAEIGLPQALQTALATPEIPDHGAGEIPATERDALQALLAFSALHEQVRRRQASEAMLSGSARARANSDEFLLFEVLQLVAERALALTGADGIAIALVHEGEIICRAASGPIAPDIGVKLDLNAGFSGFCLRTGESVRCDDTESDPRVNRQASQRLKARSMLAVPLCGRHSVLGLIEAFSAEAYGFTDSDLGSLKLLAELILGAMRPEEQSKLENLSPVAVHGKKLLAESKPQAPGVIGLRSAERVPALGTAQLEALIRQQVEGATSPKAAEKQSAGAWVESKAEIPGPATVTGIIGAAQQTPAAVELPAEPEDMLETQPPAFSTIASEASSARPRLRLVYTTIGLALVLTAGVWWRLRNRTAEAAEARRPAASQVSPQSPPASTISTPVPAESAPPASQENPLAAPPAMETSARSNLLPLISGVRHWESGDATTVAIDLQDQVQYEVHRLSDPERIYFDLHDTVLGAGLSGKTIEVGDSLLVRIRIAQPMPGVSRIVLETKDATNFSVNLEQNPFRLVATMRRQAPERKTGARFGGSSADIQDGIKDAKASTISKEDLQLRARVPHMKIVVDAGHGGWDLGTVGRQGLLEKDLVLDVTRRLGTLLETRLGTEVIYTRPDDNYIALEQRAEIANQSQADLFVSIHANNSDYAFARGVETYYTNYTSSPESAEIEKQENGTARATSDASAISDISLRERKERTDQSRRLATSVERALYGTLSPNNPGMRDRGVKEAGFVVLTGTSMPAILSEISFVSSPMDEKSLQSASYRQQIAEALYKGIARFAASSTHVKMAAASAKPTGR
jgi:N-acetylmuramoyl-L-alanine amidase